MDFLCLTSRNGQSNKIRKARSMRPTRHAGATVKFSRVEDYMKQYRKHKPKPSKNKKSQSKVNVQALVKRTKRN